MARPCTIHQSGRSPKPQIVVRKGNDTLLTLVLLSDGEGRLDLTEATDIQLAIFDTRSGRSFIPPYRISQEGALLIEYNAPEQEVGIYGLRVSFNRPSIDFTDGQQAHAWEDAALIEVLPTSATLPAAQPQPISALIASIAKGDKGERGERGQDAPIVKSRLDVLFDITKEVYESSTNQGSGMFQEIEVRSAREILSWMFKVAGAQSKEELLPVLRAYSNNEELISLWAKQLLNAPQGWGELFAYAHLLLREDDMANNEEQWQRMEQKLALLQTSSPSKYANDRWARLAAFLAEYKIEPSEAIRLWYEVDNDETTVEDFTVSLSGAISRSSVAIPMEQWDELALEAATNILEAEKTSAFSILFPIFRQLFMSNLQSTENNFNHISSVMSEFYETVNKQTQTIEGIERRSATAGKSVENVLRKSGAAEDDNWIRTLVTTHIKDVALHLAEPSIYSATMTQKLQALKVAPDTIVNIALTAPLSYLDLEEIFFYYTMKLNELERRLALLEN